MTEKSKDIGLYILIGILALHVLFKNIVTADYIAYVFIGYMIIMFIKSFRRGREEE
jgi:hypothetical protein